MRTRWLITMMVAWLAVATVGCAGVERYAVHASTDPELTFHAALSALKDCGYAIYNDNAPNGTVSGDRRLPGSSISGARIRVEIDIKRGETGANVVLTFIPPDGALGTFHDERDELRAA